MRQLNVTTALLNLSRTMPFTMLIEDSAILRRTGKYCFGQTNTAFTKLGCPVICLDFISTISVVEWLSWSPYF